MEKLCHIAALKLLGTLADCLRLLGGQQKQKRGLTS